MAVPPPCTDVYPKSSPWLVALIIVLSLLTTVVYAAFYTNTVHLYGVYMFVLLLCVLVFVWDVAAVVVLYRTPLRTSLILFSLSLLFTVVIAAAAVALYVRDLVYLSHIEIIMISVVIATSLATIVLLCALLAVLARFKPSPAAVCRPWARPRARRTGKA